MTFEVTIPVLNEQADLEKQVKKLHGFLSENFPEKGLWKIVIADNGSTDRTPEIAESLCRNFEEIKLVKVPKRGVGLALKTSWRQSEADIVGYMDLDLATDLAHFKMVMDVLVRQDYDLVYAT
ncbi:MAG TPA: glycosyltransferase, partial [Saprospiraceae bacterium]|nr:glycosyltransferase [Saprospiraceae bacterium]